MKITLLLLFILVSALSHGQHANFTDVSPTSGLNHFGANYGVAVGDFDNDGDEDIYVSTTNGEANLLYESLGDFTFREIGKQAGLSFTGTSYTAVWGDIDNDGFLDLYVGNKNEANKLYLNNGNGTFRDISAIAGVDNAGGTVSVALGDLDNDGWLDIYVANINSENLLYKNNGDKTFTNVIEASGATDTYLAMGAMLFDFDNDNDLDIYLSHDARQPNKLYENDGTGHFNEIGGGSGADYRGFGMGTDFADFNNDSFFDIYISNLYENTLLLNNRDGSFTDISSASGTDDYGMGWGVTCLDYDNDGMQDIYVANNSYFSPHPNILYKNMTSLAFINTSNSTKLESRYAGYGVASADFNNDGKVDLIVANSGTSGGNQLFKNNESDDNHWLSVKCKGTASNRAGIGTRIVIKSGGLTVTDQVASGTGYASQNSLILHFGLGKEASIEKMMVYWPSGIVDEYENIAPDQLLSIVESGNQITGIADKEDDILSVIPNPVTDHFTISPFPKKIDQIIIYSVDGRLSRNLTIQDNGVIEIPSGLNAGYYFLRILTEGRYTTKALVINR